MSGHQESIKTLIERSSLGSVDAKQARSRVSPATGKAVVRSAMTGRYTSSRSTASPSRSREG